MPAPARMVIAVAVVLVGLVLIAVGVTMRKAQPAKKSSITTAAAATTITPASSTTGAASPTLHGKVVAVDPGHNGANGAHAAEINRLVPAGGFMKECDTTGTQTDAGYTESELNLDVATRLVADLRRMGATVVLTRTANDGWGPCIDQRAAIGNQAHADAAVSIHADGGPASGRGFDVNQPAVIAGYSDPAVVMASHRLAIAIRDSFAAGTAMPPATYIGFDGIGTRSDLGGLNLSTVPKVLVECGNMRNAVDAALLTDPAFRQKAADALAAGIGAFLTGPKAPGSTPGSAAGSPVAGEEQ